MAPADDLTAERAAKLAAFELVKKLTNNAGMDPNDRWDKVNPLLAYRQTARQEALREAARVVETITLQAVKAEIRWREKHAAEEVDGVAKSERAECHLRSLGLHIKDELDRLASEGA